MHIGDPSPILFKVSLLFCLYFLIYPCFHIYHSHWSLLQVFLYLFMLKLLCILYLFHALTFRVYTWGYFRPAYIRRRSNPVCARLERYSKCSVLHDWTKGNFHSCTTEQNALFVSKFFLHWARMFFLTFHLHKKWREVENIFSTAFMHAKSLSVTITDDIFQLCINDLNLSKHQLKLSYRSAFMYTNETESFLCL